jgi:hypothetical protein
MERSMSPEDPRGNSVLQQFLADLVNGVSPIEAMRREERKAGYRPLELDERPWFSSRDWREGVVAIDDPAREVRIVAVAARTPRSGALRKMIAGISSEGMTPVIVEAMTEGMLAILKIWKWRRSIVSLGGAFEEQWRPPR